MVWGGGSSLHSGIEFGRSRTGKGYFGGRKKGTAVRSGPGVARTILLFHIISARPSKQPLEGTYLPKGIYGAWLLNYVSARTNKRHHHQANGYRSPTWRILRALQAIINANVVIGESRLTAAPFFEGAGRPSGPFWGPQQGRRVILWESLSREDQQKCLNDLQDDTDWVIWCKAKPKDMATQAFRAYGQCIFEGKREKPKQAKGTQEDISGGKHVVRARSWWKRGDVSACAAQTHMQCWVHRDTIVDEGQVEMNMREAWEHEHSKDETNIDLRGLERHFWKGTEAGCLGCYDFSGETWAGDGSMHKGVMGAGSICLQRPTCII